MSGKNRAAGKPEGEMSFIDHLEVLRWHIIRSIAAIAVFAIAAFFFIKPIFDRIILAPTREEFWTYKSFCNLSNSLGLGDAMCMKPTKMESFIVLEMPAQFLMSLKLSITIGFIVAFPYVAWEVWKFVRPALYAEEKKYARGIVFFISSLFLMGVCFGYFILTPFSVNFFANYTVSDLLTNQFKITSYISLLVTIIMSAGIMFELPIAVYILSKLGILTPDFMRTHRKHAFITILLIAAIITPADVWTQILVTIPVYFLYEISVIISARIYKKRLAQDKLDQQDLEDRERKDL